MSDLQPYGPLQPLPHGTVLLEASAGTGKTHQIASLTCRYVAEDAHGIDEILLVTFGTAATRELRTRVFERLTQVEDDLAKVVEQGRQCTDPLVQQLASRDAALRLERLRAALNGFERATIATTHTFCATMLDRLGIVADWDTSARFTKDLTQMTREVADDLYLARFQHSPKPPFDLTFARKIARQAVEHADELLIVEEHREEIEFAEAVRAEVAARKARARLYTYDDLIERMRLTMDDPVSGPVARRRLSTAFPIVLVDEFQDTDPAQWAIMSQAFVGTSTIVLIGDPKQSIYGFRNADLNCYLEAMSQANQHFTLPSNYRSDPGVVEAISRLFAGTEFGDPRVRAFPVTAARSVPRLSRIDDAISPPVQIRVISPGEHLDLATAESKVDTDLVAQVQDLLDNYHYAGQPLRPSDIAVLVRQRRRAESIVAALARVGIVSSFPGSESVLTGSAATDWLAVLEAWLRPTAANVRAAALTNLVGLGIPELIGAEQSTIVQIAEQLKECSRLARNHGVLAGWEALRMAFRVDCRLLSEATTESSFVDLAHVAELLTTTQWRDQMSLDGLHAWLTGQVAEASAADEATNEARRVPSDSDAVQILTVHGSKGLQFPVVLLPSATSWSSFGERDPFVFTEGSRRRLFVGRHAGRSAAWNRHLADQRAEELRLLYVSMTRATAALRMWWTPTNQTAESALHRLLSRGPETALRDRYRLDAVNSWPTTHRCAQIGVDRVPDNTSIVRMSPAQPPTPHLSVRRLDRTIDHTWRRSSYSALTASAHEEYKPGFDELELTESLGIERSETMTAPLPLGGCPGGVAFGSLVHLVLEYLDWSQPDLENAVAAVVAEQLRRMPIPGVDSTSLTTGLVAALKTPLTGLTEKALAELPIDQRLAELSFDLPLGRHATSTVGSLAGLLATHLGPEHPLYPYPAQLLTSVSAQETLRGVLTGSIDAVFQLGEKYLVVDYKTNRMPTAAGMELTVGDYQPRNMAQAMMASHYPLQALLYAVALHRYLDWRLPGYDPQRHLGGVGYLFVRGMNGPDTPVIDGGRCGVFTWHPSADLIINASAVLEGFHG